jgi:transcriptional regulator with XRE-family HTH domain
MSLGSVLIKNRIKKGLTQKEASNIFGVAQSTYCDWESDLAIPKAENFLKISVFYKLDLTELISGLPNINIGYNNNVTTGSNVKIESEEAILKLAEGLEKLTQMIENLIVKN